MGDFFPRKKDVVDKLRRRLEHYRHHQSEIERRCLGARPSIYEQQKQDIQLLHQRWIESKAKKAAKQSRSTRESSTTQSDNRNLVVTKLKRKIDSITAEANTSSVTATTTTSSAASETVFRFDDQDCQLPNVKNGKTGNVSSSAGNKHSGGLPSLSVQIVQQISAHPQQDTPQTIHTNVTVSSCYGADTTDAAGTTSVHTSIHCKQEPSDDGARTSSTSAAVPTSTTHTTNVEPSSSVGDIGIGIDDVEELQNILDSIEKDEDIEPSLLKEINEFNEIYDKVSSECGTMYGPLSCGSPELLKGVFPNLGPCGSTMGGMFDNNQNMNNSGMAIPVPTGLPEPTGPAAETLKQMAAQHQHQHSPGYPMKGMDHFNDGIRNGGYSPSYHQMYHSVPNMTSAYPYNHSANRHLTDSSQIAPEMSAMAYGSTKPLTHFPSDHGQQHNSPSSLQQLQNQVQSHFKPTAAAQHQLQITQTQHMQLSHGTQGFQMSQTQQVHMQPSPQQISMSQQQSFSIGQQQQQQAASEHMKIQMMEKMRMEQQQQQGHMPPQYMSRPPPEYKMHHSSRPQGPYPSTMSSSSAQNPLQTMQNMVNQTSAYGAVKSEVTGSSSPGQTAMSSQISAMQQQSISASMASNGSHLGALPQPGSSSRPGYIPPQHMQQPPAYSPVDSTTRAHSGASYTSAIMRNQRPPNVNVGPDGLNISQPHAHPDWSRANMMQAGHVGMRPGLPSNGPSQHGMAQSAAISAHMMQYQQHRPPHYGSGPGGGSMAAAGSSSLTPVQAQSRQNMPNQARGSSSGMVPNGTQMMMQHQSIQMSQQMSMHTPSPGFGMGPSAAANTSLPSTGYSMGGQSPGVGSNAQTNGGQASAFPAPPTTTSEQDEFLHFLDNPLSTEPMFGSIQNSADDFSLFEDILSGK